MKKLFFVLVFLIFFVQNAAAGNSPESYLKRAPAIPKNICSASLEDVTAFTDAVRTLKDEVKQDSENRVENLSSDEDRQKVARQYLGASGLSESDMKKLDDGNMSDAEANALAARVMAGQTGRTPSPSVDQVKKDKAESKSTFTVLERYHRQKNALSLEQQQYYTRYVLPVESEKALSTGSMAAQGKWQADHDKRLLHAKRNYCKQFTPKRIQMLEMLQSGIKMEVDKVRRYEGKQMAVVGAANQDVLLLNMVDSYLDELKAVYELNVSD